METAVHQVCVDRKVSQVSAGLAEATEECEAAVRMEIIFQARSDIEKAQNFCLGQLKMGALMNDPARCYDPCGAQSPFAEWPAVRAACNALEAK